MLVAAWVYANAFERALTTDRTAGTVRLSEAAGRLRGQLDVYKTLVNVTASNIGLTQWDGRQPNDALNAELTQIKLTYGAWEVDVTDKLGNIYASSNPSRLGKVHGGDLIGAALNTRLAYEPTVDAGNRLMQFSRKVQGSEAKPIVVIVSANLAALEFEWPVAPDPVVFFDKSNLAVSANRANLLLLRRNEKQDADAFPLLAKSTITAAPLHTFAPSAGETIEAQTIDIDIPQLELSGLIVLDTAAARASALLQVGFAAAVLAALALAGTVVVQQRRRLAEEALQSTLLEQKVEARTAELRLTQDKLVEASNLAALGRFSAGISHELNQPLNAILNFAENGKRLIGKSRTQDAVGNFAQISEQIGRITRIIGNLRTFSKQEATPTSKIDVVVVVQRAMKALEPRMEETGVELNASLPSIPALVMAGEIRLEQIITNLLTNAVDAMEISENRHLTVMLSREASNHVLLVRDTGSGIEEPERVFEPFYSTKELGASKGLGMGLALSFGLVSNFGGQLECRNHADGAEFVMSLPVVEDTK